MQVTSVWLSADSQPKLINRAKSLVSALDCHFKTLSPSIFISPAAPFSRATSAASPPWDSCNGFITPTDKLRDMIRISQQLVPGCLNGRGYCQVYLQSMLRWCSVCCHFPSDNPSILTGAGSKAIPRAIRGESIICVTVWRVPGGGGGGSTEGRGVQECKSALTNEANACSSI